MNCLDPSTGTPDQTNFTSSVAVLAQPHLKLTVLLPVVMVPGPFCVQLTSLSVWHSQTDSGDGRIGHITVKL